MEFASICGGGIGQGHYICIVQKCSVSHHGDGISTMLQGELRVLKTPMSVFAEPRMRSNILTPSLLYVWLEEHVTLDAWAECFVLQNPPSDPHKINKIQIFLHKKESRQLFWKLRLYSPPKRQLSEPLESARLGKKTSFWLSRTHLAL
jgi:hypothetical protein